LELSTLFVLLLGVVHLPGRRQMFAATRTGIDFKGMARSGPCQTNRRGEKKGRPPAVVSRQSNPDVFVPPRGSSRPKSSLLFVLADSGACMTYVALDFAGRVWGYFGPSGGTPLKYSAHPVSGRSRTLTDCSLCCASM